MTAAQAYRVLGLAPGCSERELARRFRHLARQTHPDVGGSNDQFSKLAYAYTVAVDDHVRTGGEVEITTHVTSVSGHLRRLRRLAQQRLHRLIATHHDHTSSTGGHR